MKIFLVSLFFSFSSAIFLHCDFAFDSWSPIGNSAGVYICRATPLDVSVNKTHVLGYYGTHAAGYLSSDVKAIWFRANCDQLQYVPRGLLEFFPNIVEISINYCGIVTLSGHELEEYPKLQSFTMHGTEVERIPGNFFKATSEMAFIGFQNNKIKFVGEKLLENLGKLQKVNFQENLCINEFSRNGSELKKLIEELKKKCADEENPTTTENSSENPLIDVGVPTISYEEDLQIENLNLKLSLEKLSEKFNDLREILNEILANFNSRLGEVEAKVKNCTN